MNSILAMLNIFVDPKAAVQQFAGRKWAWVAPLLVISLFAGTVAFVSAPITARIMVEDPPRGASVEQMRTAAPMTATILRVTAFATPIFIGGFTAISALVLWGVGSALGVKAKFLDLFTMLSYCGLITVLQLIAHLVVLLTKGDDFHMRAELQPAFGLGMFLSEGSSRLLVAFLNYFSPFTIWYIVMLGLAMSALTGCSKGKAFAATAPVWLLGLVFTLLGALSQ
jgi:hypothetical protein